MEDLPSELRWCEWMRRIEAVLFASTSSVAREDGLNGPKLHIASPRLKRCRCGGAGTGTFSPLSDLFSAYVAPEMLYLGSVPLSPNAPGVFLPGAIQRTNPAMRPDGWNHQDP